MIVFGRVLEATGRRPTPRANADRTHNPEMESRRAKNIFEQ